MATLAGLKRHLSAGVAEHSILSCRRFKIWSKFFTPVYPKMALEHLPPSCPVYQAVIDQLHALPDDSNTAVVDFHQELESLERQLLAINANSNNPIQSSRVKAIADSWKKVCDKCAVAIQALDARRKNNHLIDRLSHAASEDASLTETDLLAGAET